MTELEKIGKIIVDIVEPREWEKLPESKREDGSSWKYGRKITAATGKTMVSLFILAHECGHMFYEHPDEYNPAKSANKWEWEATQWALCMMQQCGLTITKDVEDFAKGALAGYVQNALEDGHHVRSRVKRYTKGIKAIL